jgi:hypothetical protein
MRWILSGLILACVSCGWHPDTALIPDAEMTLHARRTETKIYGLDVEGARHSCITVQTSIGRTDQAMTP